MSRLYVWIKNDRGQEATLRGDTHLTVQVNYGNKDNSKYLVELNVTWEKGDALPKVSVHPLSEIEFEKTLVI